MFDRKEYYKRYYQEHKTEYAERGRKWREQNPDKVKESAHKQYLKRKEREQG